MPMTITPEAKGWLKLSMQEVQSVKRLLPDTTMVITQYAVLWCEIPEDEE